MPSVQSSLPLYRYYLGLAWRNCRKHPWYVALTALIVGAGVGVFMTAYSLMHALAGDPIPDRSQRLLHISASGVRSDSDPGFVSFPAFARFREAGRGAQWVGLTYGFGGIAAGDGSRRTADLVRFTNASFFPAFEVPLRRGRAWTADEEASGQPLAVVSTPLATQLFGGADPIGRTLEVAGKTFRVIGVAGDWHPVPHFYDLSVGAYAPADNLYLPLASVGALGTDLFMARSCPPGVSPDVSAADLPRSRCASLQAWSLLDSTRDRKALEQDLAALVPRGRTEGWLAADQELRVENVRELLRRKANVPGGVRLGLLLAGGFLLLCLVNATGLLLAMFLRRTHEIGIRRALGASRKDILRQFGVEAGVLGLLGSMAGLAITFGGVRVSGWLPKGFLQLASVDTHVFLAATGVSVVATVAAAMYPAWRASAVEPAI